jgi:hypothetical protein
MDLTTRRMMIDYSGPSPADAVWQMLLAGRNGGTWGGLGGINTSSGAADTSLARGIAWGEASDIFNLAPGTTGLWATQVVDATTIVLQYAWYGDANFNGKIDGGDYAQIDRGMALGLTGWVNGDFDYSGVIDQGDYLLLDRAYVVLGGGAEPGMLADREARFGDKYVIELMTSVPEPTGLGVAAVAVGRRRRKLTGW